MGSIECLNSFFNHISVHFDKRAQKYDFLVEWAHDKQMLNIFHELLDIPPDSNILDVATGTGIMGGSFKNQSKCIVGIDISKGMLQNAINGNNVDIPIIGNGECLPFLDDTFDVVLCRQGIHYMNPRKAIEEMYRVCKPDGICLIAQVVVNDKDLEWWKKILSVKQPLRKEIFTINRLKDLFTLYFQYGLDFVTYRRTDSVKRWLSYGDLPKEKKSKVFNLFLDSPHHFKEFYQLDVQKDDIIYSELWLFVRGRK